MQVAEKQKISPWDVLEGHKTPAPLSWAWFGAVKHERKPMKYEEGFQELKRATIVLEKPKSYYTDPPPLPPEDLEPAFNQNKDGMQNPKDSMGQMGMMGMRGPMGGQMPGQMGGQPYGPGGPGQMMPQHMMGGNPPQMQGYNPAYGGQRMPAYMGGGPQMQGGRMMNPQMSPMGQGGPGGPGGPRGPMMNMNMGMGMPQHMMGPRGARPMNLPPGARPNMMQQVSFQFFLIFQNSHFQNFSGWNVWWTSGRSRRSNDESWRSRRSTMVSTSRIQQSSTIRSVSLSFTSNVRK